MTVKGSVVFRNCVFMERDVVSVGCQGNITKPMEKAFLKQLGPSIPDVTVSTFLGTSCLFYPSIGTQVTSSTEGNIATTGIR